MDRIQYYSLIILFLILLGITLLSHVTTPRVEYFTIRNSNQPKVAICVCGAVRTFGRQPYRESLVKMLDVYPQADIFLYFKTHDKPDATTLLNHPTGASDFMKTVDVIKNNIKHVVFFKGFSDEKTNKSTFISQLLNVDYCLKLAEKYDTYDYYIRTRPDYVILQMNAPNTIDDYTSYTALHNGSPANDMVYLFSRKLKKDWWDSYVLSLPKQSNWYNHITPEFILMKDIKVQKGPQFYGGLLRNNVDELESFTGTPINVKFHDISSLNISEKSYIEDSVIENIVDRLIQLGIPCDNYDYLPNIYISSR